MAIAAFCELETCGDGIDEIPWPKPELRLVGPDERPAGGESEIVWEEAEGLPVRTGAEVSVRRQARAARLRRRRLVSVLALVVVAIALLALPTSALAARPAGAGSARAGVASAGSVYVVQPGDTLWSIASRVEQGSGARVLVREMAAQTGSLSVYPGERIRLP